MPKKRKPEVVGLSLTHNFDVSPISAETLKRFDLAKCPVPVISARYTDGRSWFLIPNMRRIPTWVPTRRLRYEGVAAETVLALQQMHSDGLLDSEDLLKQLELLEGAEVEQQPTDIRDEGETPSPAGDEGIR